MNAGPDEVPTVVMKFGGTSVADGAAMRRLAAIVAAEPARKVVIVSALSGVTDALLRLASLAASGEIEAAMTQLARLRQRHHEVAQDLEKAALESGVRASLDSTFGEIGALLRAVGVLHEISPRALDAVAAAGELASSRLVAAALSNQGIPAVLVDPRELLVTDAHYNSAAPLMDESTSNMARTVAPLLAAGQVVVTGGFVGATRDGITTTLGRGGSDFSAAIVGACLGVQEIQIWTDVDGMLTADPRIVDGPHPVSELSFAEAHELALLGAKVLHPATIEPAVKRNIPVRVLNSRRPEAPGTLITAGASTGAGVACALACRRPITVIEIESQSRLRSEEFLSRICESLHRCHASVALMTASHFRVALAMEDERQVDAVVDSMSSIGHVSTHPAMALLSMVSKTATSDAAMLADAMTALAGIPVRMVSQLPTGRSVVIVVRDEDVRLAMGRLHEQFFPAAAGGDTVMEVA